MQKFIKVGNDDHFPVVEVYPYIYEGGVGKQVLRIVVDPMVKTYDDLFRLLSDNTLPISEIWEEETPNMEDPQHPVKVLKLKAEHTGYSKNYKCSFNGDDDFPNQYYIEITRKTAAELLAESNQLLIDSNNQALIGLFESQKEKGGQ